MPVRLLEKSIAAAGHWAQPVEKTKEAREEGLREGGAGQSWERRVCVEQRAR